MLAYGSNAAPAQLLDKFDGGSSRGNGSVPVTARPGRRFRPGPFGARQQPRLPAVRAGRTVVEPPSSGCGCCGWMTRQLAAMNETEPNYCTGAGQAASIPARPGIGRDGRPVQRLPGKVGGPAPAGRATAPQRRQRRRRSMPGWPGPSGSAELVGRVDVPEQVRLLGRGQAGSGTGSGTSWRPGEWRRGRWIDGLEPSPSASARPGDWCWPGRTAGWPPAAGRCRWPAAARWSGRNRHRTGRSCAGVVLPSGSRCGPVMSGRQRPASSRPGQSAAARRPAWSRAAGRGPT